MIEHSWAPITASLCGLVLHPTLPGEQLTPEEQTTLSADERQKKNATVLEMAMTNIQRCLEKTTFDGFPVTTEAVKSSAEHIYQNEADIEALSDGSISRLKNNKDLRKKAREYRFISQHSVQRTYMLEFIKCEDDDWRHYSATPIRAKNLMSFLRSCSEFIPSLTPAEEDPNFFGTIQL